MDTRLTPRLLGIAAIAATLVLALAILALAIMATRPAPAAAATVPSTPTAAAPGVTVAGTARVEGVPDTLRLDMGVNVIEKDVETALTKANEASATLQQTLRDNGVAERDLASTGLSIQPQQDWSKNTPVIIGYQVTQTITAKLRDVDKAGAVIGAAAAAGGNATIVNGISWDIDDNEALLKDARDRAIADARARAEQYAKAAGRGLGQVVSITESTSSTPQPYAYEAHDMASGASSVPLAPGTQTVAVDVVVVYAFG